MRKRWLVMLPLFGLCVSVWGAGNEEEVTGAALRMDTALFRPNPTKAVWLALIPGMGQVYNRKYWKLPIVYGSLMGCFYAITWNNRNYTDYWNAYKDIMSDDPMTNNRWQDLLPGNILTNEAMEDYAQDASFKENLRQRKDYFRRYRDMSVIISVGVYAISIIDAYVDAQLFDFDISPDLSLRLAPAYTPHTTATPSALGLTCSITF